MKKLLALSFLLICFCHANARYPENTDTVIVNMLSFASGETDSSLLSFSRDIQRYFNRNLRAAIRGREVMLGYATVSFVVDKQGNVADARCTSNTNHTVGQEALRVVRRFSKSGTKPLLQNGSPVVAKVTMNIGFTSQDQITENKEDIHSKAAVIVVSYAPIRN